jgi:class 3 adenylate cyclase
VQDFRGLAFRFLVAIDLEGFSRLHPAEQARAQSGLDRAMWQASAGAGLDRRRWYRQPGGDGELAVLPAGTDGLAVVADYPRKLASAITALNREPAAGPRLRVRLAIHHGTVLRGPLGPVGTAPVIVSRLLDAEAGRQHLLEHPELNLALVVSAPVYDEVIQSRMRDLYPDSYDRIVVTCKEVSYFAYLCRELAPPDQGVQGGATAAMGA